MKRFFLIFGIFFISGCTATLEDFQEMSSYEELNMYVRIIEKLRIFLLIKIVHTKR